MLLGKPVEAAPRIQCGQRLLQDLAEAVHAGREKLQHDGRIEAVHNQTAEAVPFGVDEAVGVCERVEAEPPATQFNGLAEPAREEVGVDRLGGVGGQHAQGDARVAVVKAASDPLAGAIEDVHDAAGGQALGRLFDHLLKDPRMGRASFDLQAHLRQDFGCHAGYCRFGVRRESPLWIFLFAAGRVTKNKNPKRRFSPHSKVQIRSQTMMSPWVAAFR